MPTVIFQLGTNNWQTDDEPAPGSGILHEIQHNLLNQMDNVRCYSIFPSRKHQKPADRVDYRVFKLDHPIPICESAAPESSFRWHSMSEMQFSDYRQRLANEVYEYMEEIEKDGAQFSLAIAHHAFLNALVMCQVIDRRVREGKTRTPLVCYLHSTGLKMFEHELAGQNQAEYPMRFYAMMVEAGVFADTKNAVTACIAGSPATAEKMIEVFPNFPKHRILQSPCGVDGQMFYPRPVSLQQVLELLGQPLWPKNRTQINIQSYKKIIVYAGKLADIKRVEAILMAAQKYSPILPDTCTVIIGGGPENYMQELQQLAEGMQLRSVFFVGPRSQDALAQVFTVACLGVFPTFEESFGQVFIECMACGCPVIGADSGGPSTYITSEVGELVPEPGMAKLEKLSDDLAEVVCRAVREDWKSAKGQACMKLVNEKFSSKPLTAELLDMLLKAVTEE